MTNNFIITGIPRSGTTLLCKLMNHIENTVCLNEIPAFYDVPNLNNTFNKIKILLLATQSVPMNIGNDNEIITDTQNQPNEIGMKKVDINIDKPLFIGSKINVPYLLQIDNIIKQDLKIIGIVRNPIYAIASWNKYANINERYVMPEDFKKWPRYSTFDFKSNNKFERQAELWSYLADIIQREINWVIRYEDVVNNPQKATVICGMIMDIVYDITKVKKMPDLNNMNDDSRFNGIDLGRIRSAVKKYCKKETEGFGYDVL